MDFYDFSSKLKLVFWGVIFIVLDLNVNSSSFSFDLLPDIAGSIMVVIGIFHLKKFRPSNEAYTSGMNIAFIAGLIQLVFSGLTLFGLTFTSWISFVFTLLTIFIVYGIIRFCKSMQEISREFHLEGSLPRWRQCEQLFFWIYFIPIGVLSTIGGAYDLLVQGQRFQNVIDVSMGGFLTVIMVAILTIPVIYGLFVISKMKGEIEGRMDL